MSRCFPHNFCSSPILKASIDRKSQKINPHMQILNQYCTSFCILTMCLYEEVLKAFLWVWTDNITSGPELHCANPKNVDFFPKCKFVYKIKIKFKICINCNESCYIISKTVEALGWLQFHGFIAPTYLFSKKLFTVNLQQHFQPFIFHSNICHTQA